MTENVIDEAVEFIKTFEGLRLQAYSDDGGTWTIGYGSTGDHIHAGLVWSLAYAEADLRRRVDAAHTQLLTISPSMRAESIGRQVALTDFVFNEGIERYKTSTLRKMVDQAMWGAAQKQLPKWVYCDRKVLRGLVKRRAAEAALLADDLQVAANA